MVQGYRLFLALLNNLAIFLALVAMYRYLLIRIRVRNSLVAQTLYGLVFGIFAIGCMYARIPVYYGVIVDQRNAIVALSAVFGGPVAAVVAASMAAALRAFLGGDGVISGVTGIGLAALSGMLLRRMGRPFATEFRALRSALIATMLIVPGFLLVGDLQTGWALLQAMFIPYGSAIFLGIFIVGLLLEHEEHHFRVEHSRRESEEKYRVLFESFPLGITISDASGKVVETNSAAARFSGLHSGELQKILRADGTPMPANELPGAQALRLQEHVTNIELGLVGADDTTTWFNTTAAPIPLPEYGVAVSYNDITDRKATDTRLQQALHEKTVLVQELYHRTRNNLQLIIGLLDWQSAVSGDPKIQAVFRETQDRIQSIALVHQHLYRARDLSFVNLNIYVADLLRVFMSSYQVSDEQVELSHGTDEVLVLIDTAVPFGLLCGELFSNAFRHGFSHEGHSRLSVKLLQKGDDEIVLHVADNGPGLPPDFNPRTHGRLGFQTIFALGEQQLEGRVEVLSQGASAASESGLTVSLVFKDNVYSSRV